MTEDRLARIRLLLGEEGVNRLKSSFVTVVGLGAVGSYAVEGLARAGVGRLRLVDFDIVKASNINRQLYALSSTLGERKTSVAAARVLDINPHCRVEPMNLFGDRESFDAILEGGPDIVIDAIDSMGPKTNLIMEACSRKLPLISSMGAALRTDPGAIRVGPLRETRNCPLAARLKYWLKKHNSPLDFTCVYSLEPVDKVRKARLAPHFGVVSGGKSAGQPDPAEKDFLDRAAPLPGDLATGGWTTPPLSAAHGHNSTAQRFPLRPRAALGSLPTITGIFGLTIANTAIKMLLAKPAAKA